MFEEEILRLEALNFKLQTNETTKLYKNEVHCHGSARISLLQKGGVPAAPSGTATLLRLSPSH